MQRVLDRTVLTGGAMVGLALVPAVALIAVGAVYAEPSLAASGALRWGVDAARPDAFVRRVRLESAPRAAARNAAAVTGAAGGLSNGAIGTGAKHPLLWAASLHCRECFGGSTRPWRPHPERNASGGTALR